MQNWALIFGLNWVALCSIVWILLRNKKPDILGLGKDLNKQKIDGVKFSTCPSCEKGSLNPIFKWWQYCIGITLPPGIIYIIGSPTAYQCTNCDHIEIGEKAHNQFTRISLTHKLTKPYYIAMAVNLMIAVILVIIVDNIFKAFGW